MPIDFDTIRDRKNTGSVKWNSNVKLFGNPDVIPMWVADMDFASPPEVIEAIIARAAHGIFGYTDVSRSYLEGFRDWMQRRNNWQVKTEWIVHSPGVVTSISLAVLAFTDPHDKILIQTPIYTPFYTCVTENDRELVLNPLILHHGSYGMDFDDLDRKLSGQIKMMILCSPHNPVSRVWRREELVKLAELCLKHQVLLVSDEIHSDLIFQGYKHQVMADVSEDIRSKTITLASASKTFNLAGLSSSVAVIPDQELRNKFKKTIKTVGVWMPNIFGMLAAETAYVRGEYWLEQLLDYLQANRDWMADFISRHIPRLRLIKPEGTYLAWLDCRDLGLGDGLNAFFAGKARVGFSDGGIYGEDGKGFQRVNFACPRPVLSQALRNMEKAVREIGA